MTTDRPTTPLRTTDRIEVTGPQAESYLQGQMSQDLTRLAQGETAQALLLEPSGKLGFWFEVERTPGGFLLSVEAGQGPGLLERLNRFKLRTKAEFVVITDNGADDGADDDAELERILAGRPRHGAEIVAGETIPAELGQQLIDDAVSFTKGCYTGQELVARIDSRGNNVPRHLRRLTIEAAGPDGLPEPGTELWADGKVVGRLTSVAWLPDARTGDGTGVGLGFVGRAIEVPGTVELAGGGKALVTAV